MSLPIAPLCGSSFSKEVADILKEYLNVDLTGYDSPIYMDDNAVMFMKKHDLSQTYPLNNLFEFCIESLSLKKSGEMQHYLACYAPDGGIGEFLLYNGSALLINDRSNVSVHVAETVLSGIQLFAREYASNEAKELATRIKNALEKIH